MTSVLTVWEFLVRLTEIITLQYVVKIVFHMYLKMNNQNPTSITFAFKSLKAIN